MGVDSHRIQGPIITITRFIRVTVIAFFVRCQRTLYTVPSIHSKMILVRVRVILKLL